MRPISLTMEAFGSYVGPVTVPFSELRQGLYLVTGNTGAGKTTIFDGIMFALYGVASGKDRTMDMLHCDFAEMSRDTKVTLVFQQGGMEYTVSRTIHFQKKRGTQDQYGEPKADAILQEPEREPLVGANKVTARCTELLGLSAEQFRKIVMLAQGEFREFLRADSDKKNEILGKLFDNSAYVYYQSLLAGARDGLRQRREEARDRVTSVMTGLFQLPDGETAEDYLPEHPELPDHLENLMKRESAALEELTARREQAMEEITCLESKKGAADAANRALEEQERWKARLRMLEEKQPEMDRRQKRWEAAEAAFVQVRPKETMYRQVAGTLEKTQRTVETLRAEFQTRTAQAEAAETTVQTDAPDREKMAEIAGAIQSLEALLPQYQILQEQVQKQRRIRSAAKLAREQAETCLKSREQEKEALEQIEKKLAALAQAETEVLAAQTAQEAADHRCAVLAGPGGIRQQRDSLKKDLMEQERKRDTLMQLTLKAMEKSEYYHRLYQRFLAGQAGLLASRLSLELADRGEAQCPVCRTRFQGPAPHSFAPLLDDTPEQEQVEQARLEADQAEQDRSRMDKNLEAAGAAVSARMEALCRQAEALSPELGVWETLAGDGLLETVIRQASDERTQAGERLSRARERQALRARLLAQQADSDKRLTELRLQAEELDANAHRQEAEALAMEASLETLRAQLPWKTEAEALAVKAEHQKTYDALLQRTEAHQKALDEARRQQNLVKGQLLEQENALPDQLSARNTAEQSLQRAVAQAGFSSLESVHEALAPAEAGGGQEWLRKERQALTDYLSDCRNTRSQIETLSEQTRGMVPTDLEALGQEIVGARTRFSQLNAACGRQEQLLTNHRSVCRHVREARAALARTEGAWTRLDYLGTLAAGASGTGGKLSFDRYVMGTVFREILDMANRRLDRMSGGKYQLLHRIGADRRNAKSGLEIQVLDLSTGRERDAGSLSGGETFLASLALALGLSDVVQNHAGGRQLDALFVDEGFGALSEGALDRAMEVLGQLTEGNRLVGIISHVDKLEECIPQKIRVQAGPKGSSLTVEPA